LSLLNISYELEGNADIKSSSTAELVNSKEDLRVVELMTFRFANQNQRKFIEYYRWTRRKNRDNSI